MNCPLGRRWNECPSPAVSCRAHIRHLLLLADNRQSAYEFHWAWLDTKCQYRRSKVGPLWETINVAVMIAAISLVSSGLFGAKMEDVIGYIGLGLIIWSAIAGLVADGCGLS